VPVFGAFCEACSDRVLQDVLAGSRVVVLVFDGERREAFAEQVAPALVAAVERLGVDAVQALHAGREPFEIGLDDQVVVVRHQAEGVDPPLVALDHLGEEAEEEAVLVVVLEDSVARHATRRDVVDAGRR
jgi:hypothetical protein